MKSAIGSGVEGGVAAGDDDRVVEAAALGLQRYAGQIERV
jgi:hypothetical protein